ncbi:MAG: glucose-6-phosphate isomerase [Eubacteriales bacterium]|nr:glucose-6-phosphate isomerase [Eubacteriales bacterium]
MKKETLRLDVNNMMDAMIGAGYGISADQLNAVAPLAAQAAEDFRRNRGTGMMGWSELPYQDVSEILELAKQIRARFRYFVLLGIGGSALGPIAIQQALNHMRYNELPDEKRNGPKFYVEDNVDPERMKQLFDVIDPAQTCFNVITKSGSTSETMSQYLIVNKLLTERLGDRAAEHIVATTDREKGNLIRLARREGYRTLVIPASVGGRFSELSPVGLLAAAVCGIDIRQLLAGAAYMDELCAGNDLFANPALMAAATQYLAMKNGKTISVMMPYADSLKYMSDWYAQLWGESLGKRYALDGSVVNAGQTPVKALGVTDQHSQVQLYTEGPFDKVVTFLGVDEYREHVDIPDGAAEIPAVNFLCGHSLNELIKAEQFATAYALTSAHRMNCTITLPSVNAFTIGQLLQFFEIQTAYVGSMLGINTFDQPGVEAGKNATYALLGRPGYDEKRAELAAAPKPDERFIL